MKCPALSLVLAICGSAASGGGPCGGFVAAGDEIRAMLDGHPLLAGAALLIGDREGVLHESYYGSYRPSTVVPVASASKLLSGVAILTLADDGLLDLDAPVERYLPEEFASDAVGLKSTMTVRQMFAHISGLPGDETSGVLSDTTITLAEAAAEIACCVPLEDVPGASFAYGGLSMQVGGRVAEVVSGRDWESFFVSAVGGPLGLDSIDYQGLGPTTNPRIAGGAQSNLRDYGRVMAMLLGGGEVDGVRVLGEQTVAEMMMDRTAGLPRRSPPPPGGEDYGYGFGGWVSRVDADGTTVGFTSPGAFGFTPWVDLERGIYGVIMIEGSRQVVLDHLDAIQAAVEAEVDGCASLCPGDLVEPFGVVNFFDIAAYLDRYSAGLMSADLAPPLGSLNFFDVAAYLGRYNAGCR
ncbi:MAG: class A beta-lactamase-related serine hydrolase [Planctomycetota bacterium]|nr:MAG: class A beta-lactamase-related serine hydrolase [Planctomycetota bacterium]